MKKYIYIAVLVFAVVAKGFADDNKKVAAVKEAEASYFAVNNFMSKFQSAENVKWTVTNDFQKASFTLNGKKLAAFFDVKGDYIATTQYVDFKKLPAVSKSRLGKLYQGYQVEDVVKYDLDVQGSQFDVMTGRRNYDSIYFASLKNNKESLIVKITPDGEISYLKNF